MYSEYKTHKNSDPIITVRNLTAKYNDKIILDDISFEVFKGEIFAVLGGSGCGKTTLFNHLIGLNQPASGKILVCGEDISVALGQNRLESLRKIGVMYQNGALFSSMTLVENVSLPLERFTNLPQKAINFVAYDKLKTVGLSDFTDYMPSEISGGMKKRAAIARAMALDPDIIFLDEPSAGLDPINSMQLDNLILTLSKTLNITFVMVSHEISSINAIADRIIMLYDKKIIASGKPLDLEKETNNKYVKQFLNRKLTD